MSKSRATKTQTRLPAAYEARARGQFQHQSTVYRPINIKKQPILMPSPNSCFYGRIMSMINKIK